MTLQEKFHHHLSSAFPFIKKEHLIYVACSGGLDSTMLLYLLQQEGFKIAALHCNFHLRANESDRDENFVRTLCTDLNIPLEVLHADTKAYSIKCKISIQEAARDIRYNWFYEKVTSSSNSYVATAHQADDAVETFMIHASRGTGIKGLLGIPHIQGHIIRPLLKIFRDELSAYATEKNISWIEDSSNTEDYYTRNFIRNKVLPILSEKLPQASKNIAQSIHHLHDAYTLYQQALAVHLKKLCIAKGSEMHIPVLLLLQSKPVATILWEIIQPYNFSTAQVQDVLQLCHAHNGAYTASSTHRIIRNRKWLIIASLQSKAADHILIEKNDELIETIAGRLLIQEKEATEIIPTDTLSACIDAKQISYPLILRPWKTGDYFYPLGMNKKKKLNRFLIDLKLSTTAKEKVMVLESDKKIVWVVGLRIDHRYRIVENTTNTLQLKWMPD